jgi:transcriptional regulator with XRE-family HTH domain
MSETRLRIAQLMRLKKLSGKDLALKLNMSENNISFLKKGKTKPTFKTLEALADAFNVDITELFEKTKDTFHIIYKDKLHVLHSLEELEAFVFKLKSENHEE